MSNRKIEKLLKDEGFCCLWAFFRTHERTSTSDIRRLFDRKVTKRAVQMQRARYIDEQYHCLNCPGCLKKKKTV